MRDAKDRSMIWLIGHHGDSILRLAEAPPITRWRAAQSQVAVPKRLPDGLVEAELPGQDRPVPFLIEIATYPENRAVEQALSDILMVYMDRGELPEVVVLVLYPKGQVEVEDQAQRFSRLGWTTLGAKWRVRYLWTIPAAVLLAMDDVGIIPLVPLSRIDGPPEEVLRQCGERIEQLAPANERANLLAVSQILTQMRYNEKRLLDLLGGKQAMIESPLIQELLDDPEVVRRSRALQELLADRELVRTAPALRELMADPAFVQAAPALPGLLAKGRQRDLHRILAVRFGQVPPEILSALQGITGSDRLDELIDWAASCPDLEAFRSRL